ncbi:MAG: NUDIX hydrolase [Nanoarchaeota archaeon]|nr:NUDIX hydrolase [Nanoarchaeota archaeon]
MGKWKVLDSNKIIENKWITVEKQKCAINEKTIIEDYYIIKKKDYVIIVAEDNDEILFLKQYRHAIGEFLLNLPMGVIDEGESAEGAAKREFSEETGYEINKIKYIGELFLAPGYLTTKAYLFFTDNIKKIKNRKIDDKENLTLARISKNKLKELIEENVIKDMSTLASIFMVKENLRLF